MLHYALYSVPTLYVGKEVEVKGTKALVRIYLQQQLIKTHPKVAAGRGHQQGSFMTQLLNGDVPWIFIRQAQVLLRLGDKYGSTRVEAACKRALTFGLPNVKQVEGILKQARNHLERETTPVPAGGSIASLPARFERDADYFSLHTNKEEHDHGSNM